MAEGTEGGKARSEKAIHAYPTKDFFVKMITRDIALKDCIFDLLDNAIDGAGRFAPKEAGPPLGDFRIDISFDQTLFMIEDNCGGIRLDDAILYAFNFGKREGSPGDVAGGIGLYGIGMKRAIFKMGRKCDVLSKAEDACFKVIIDVAVWEKQKQDDWDFDYEDATATGPKGTKITITDLYPEIANQFADAVFRNDLIKSIARDYAFFIDRGLSVRVCGDTVPGFKYQLRETDAIKPAVKEYVEDDVTVRILAGLIDDLPDEVPDELRLGDVERYGWFVACNDRVVLAGDKTSRTVWGDTDFPVWHNQYNGFAGFVLFHARDQRKLPWTTTKRGLDDANPVFRHAVAVMKDITLEFIKYTNRRKADLEAAKVAEQSHRAVDISELTKPQALTFPTFASAPKGEPVVNIIYKRKKKELDEIRRHLRRPTMSNKDIGVLTFEYYVDAELPK
jgi:hypothetical protein